MAKSISSSRLKCSSWSGVMRPYEAWRTVSGVSTCLLIGMIAPSIFTLMGEFEVKKRSEALRSTISLNSGRVLSTIGAPFAGSLTSIVSTNCSFTFGISAIWFRPGEKSERATLLLFVDHAQRAAVVEVLHFALALELDLEPQLVLGVRVAQGVFVGNEAGLVQVVERLVEGLHADARRTRHDFLDLVDLAL